MAGNWSFRGRIDGSKFKAVNGKKRNFNRAKLERRIKEIEAEIEKYFRELEDDDLRESSVSAVSAEELRAKTQWLKERGEEYKGLLKRLIESGESQISLTDPDSRAMLNNQRVEVCYNVQATVDSKHKLLLDHEVINKGTDYNQLSEMSRRAKEILGVNYPPASWGASNTGAKGECENVCHPAIHPRSKLRGILANFYNGC